MVGGDETAAAAVLARCTEVAAQGLLRRDLQSDGALDYAKGGHDRAQGCILDVPHVWDYLGIPIVLLLTETYVDIVNVVRCCCRQIVGGALASVEELEVLVNEDVRVRTGPVLMRDFFVLLLRLLAPLDAAVANESPEEEPIN